MSNGEFSNDMIFYAFRYCLGRHTGAVNTCVDYLIRNWEYLNKKDRQLIVKEIRQEIQSQNQLNRHITDVDRKEWQKIIDMDKLTLYDNNKVKEKRWYHNLKVCPKCSKSDSVQKIVTNGRTNWCSACGLSEKI